MFLKGIHIKRSIAIRLFHGLFLALLWPASALSSGRQCVDLLGRPVVTVQLQQQEEAFLALQSGDRRRYIQLTFEIEQKLLAGEIVQSQLVPDELDHSTEVYFVTLSNGLKAVWKPDAQAWTTNKDAFNSNPLFEIFAYQADLVLSTGLVPVTVRYNHRGVFGTLQAFVDKNALLETQKMSDEKKQGYWAAAKFFDLIFGVVDRELDVVGREERHNYLVYNDQPVLYDNGMLFFPERYRRAVIKKELLYGIDLKNPELKSFYRHLKYSLTPEILMQLLSQAQVEPTLWAHVLLRRDDVLQILETSQ